MNQNKQYANGNLMKENYHNKFDEYYTKTDIAKYLYNKTRCIISQYDNIENYIWIDPSVGDGSFYNILPINKKIGIDIKSINQNIIQQDYLTYELPNKKIIIIGNPPFGHRGVLALDFINHSSKAEYIAFILPMFFQSLGKGSIRYRVQNFNLIHDELIPKQSFYDNKLMKISNVQCCFQIWSKYHKSELDNFSWYINKNNNPFDEMLDVKTVSLAKNRECGKEYIFNKKVNFYLSSSFFKSTTVVKNFNEVKYKSGIAIIYKTRNKNIIEILDNIFINADWTKYSSLATNGVYHIGKSHIYNLLSDNGILKLCQS